MSLINIQDDHVQSYVSEGELAALGSELEECQLSLERGTGKGADFLGWVRLPSRTSEAMLSQVEEHAQTIREKADILICIGIGGSYLGAQAGIEFLKHKTSNYLEVQFTGHHIDSRIFLELFNSLEDRSVYLNLISRSGKTLESALAFRFLREMMEKRYGKLGAAKRIFITTCSNGGVLNDLIDSEGYKILVIPDDVGGRFSVLTSAGLLPLASAGINIRKLLAGAQEMENLLTKTMGIQNNPAWKYVALREVFRKKGKIIEVLASFQPGLRYILEWWKQLAGESEGKKGRGLFPAYVQYPADLHSLGQWVQEGPRKLFETFLWVESDSDSSLLVPLWEKDHDKLNYLAGKRIEIINRKAFEATQTAHGEGGVPNLKLEMKGRTPQTLGALFYFFQMAVSLTGYLLKVNPFDQPGVEMYKRNMFSLLKQPDYREGN